MGVLTDLADWFWSVVGALDAAEWSALAAVITALIALAAAVFAFVQVREARRLRIEQARPYVAAFLELGSEIDVTFILLVVKNFGTTTARDITIATDRPMKRAWGNSQHPEDLLLFDRLPVLVPGQSWRTLFDWGPDRFKAGLDETYTLTVSSHDSSGHPLKDEVFVLDWNTFKPTRNVGVKTVHDVGKSLQGIEKTLGRWTEGVRGLSVVSRDGHRKDSEANAEYLEREREWEAEADSRREAVIEQDVDATSNVARYQLAGDEETLSAYPSSDEASEDDKG